MYEVPADSGGSGPGRLCRRAAGAGRAARPIWTSGGELVDRDQRAQADAARSPWSASTSSCRMPTSACARRCTTRRWRTGGDVEVRWINSEELERGRGLGRSWSRWMASSCRAALATAASRARSLGRALGAGEQGALPGSVPGHAGDGHRVGPSRRWAATSPTAPSSTPTPASRDRPDARSAGHRGHGWHDAAGDVSLPVGAGHQAAAAYGGPMVEERHRHRFEFNNAYRDLLDEAGLVFQRPVARRAIGRDRRTGRPSLYAGQPVSS